MQIRGSPNGAGYLRPQTGRDCPESVVALTRNGWSQSIGTAGRDRPVRAAGNYAAIDGLSPECSTEIADIGRTGQPAIAVRPDGGISPRSRRVPIFSGAKPVSAEVAWIEDRPLT